MIRMLFALIDSLVYGFISILMRLTTIIAYTDIFTEKVISDFKDKVLIVLSVVMLFKIVISCIQYIMSPDTFDDREKGMSEILKRTAICIVLLLALDPLFGFAMKIQVSILETIPRIIFNTNSYGDNVDLGSIGSEIAWATLSSFVSKTDSTTPLNDTCPFGSDSCSDPLLGFIGHIQDGCDWITGFIGCDYDYTIILSTICGAFILYSLVGILLDVGIRVLKLGVIRILYPIPVANYINKKDSLSKLFKTYISVYTDLFIRMGVIYFAVYTLRILLKSFFTSNDIFKNVPQALNVNFVDRTFIRVILILAIIFFIKKAPQFICDFLGLEGKGEDFKDMFTRPARGFMFAKSVGRDFRASMENSRREAGDGYDSESGKWIDPSKKHQAIKNAFRTTAKSSWAGAKSVYRHDNPRRISQTMRDAAAEEHDLNRQLYENEISRSQYRDALRLQRRGVVSGYASADKNAQIAKNASDKSKAVLDAAHAQMSEKFYPVTFDKDASDEVKERLLKSLQADRSKKKYTFGKGKGPYEVEIDLDKIVAGDQEISSAMEILRVVAENKNGMYNNDAAPAKYILDKLQGASDKHVVSTLKRAYDLKEIIKNNPSGSPEAEAAAEELRDIERRTGFDAERDLNIGLLDSMARAEEASTAHTPTEFDKAVFDKSVAEAEKYGYTTGSDEEKVQYLKQYHYGDWVAINKSVGSAESQRSTTEKASHGAEAIARELAEKHKNDK